MPIYDYCCPECGIVFEGIGRISDKQRDCAVCGSKSDRIISCGGAYLGNQDATWLKTVGDVIGNDTVEDRIFHKNPTRDNYKTMMHRHGIRPLEPNEKPNVKPKEADSLAHITKQLLKNHTERAAITIY